MPATDTHLTLDAETHTYWHEGRKIPSVTQILKGVGLIDTSWFTEEATLRGTCVHEATHLDDLGTLDENTVDEAVWPYLEQWRKFRAEMGVTITAMEQMIYSPIYGYAGTLDRTLLFAGNPVEVLGDIKAGARAKWHALQTAAYQDNIGRYTQRGTIRLTPGRYYWEPHNDPKDIEVFRSACVVRRNLEHHAQNLGPGFPERRLAAPRNDTVVLVGLHNTIHRFPYLEHAGLQHRHAQRCVNYFDCIVHSVFLSM